MIIPIDIRHVFLPGSPPAERDGVMRALQDCLVSCDRAWRRRHGVSAANLSQSRVSTSSDECGPGYALLDMAHVFRPDSHETDDSLALKACLDCMVEIDRIFLRTYRSPKLYDCGARFTRTEDWRPTPAIIASRKADCKSFGPARCAELLEDGVPVLMVHRWAKRDEADGRRAPRLRQDGTDFHILLMVDGRLFEDPSKILGMEQDGANSAEY